MNLKVLSKAIKPVSIVGELDRDITAVCYDSRRAIEGSLFVALRGDKVDGTNFIDAAIDRGAVAIVSEKSGLNTRAAHIHVENARQAIADLASTFYRHPSHHVKVAGVTGTNGKTTTTFLIKHILDSQFLRCGLIGTIGYIVGDRELPAARTTPESADVHELLWQMRSAGCKSCAMEVSSHAMIQERVRGVEFDAGVFTNLTQDHLDFHGTMEAYFEAKAALFAQIRDQREKKGRAVLNIDDRFGVKLADRFGREMEVITYGLRRDAHFRASNVQMDFTGMSYQLDALEKSYLVRLPLIGNFNVANSLAAIATAHALSMNVRNAVQALATAPAVPGRLQAVPAQKPFRVFVDYAHTDDALTNVLKTLRELNPARLIAVFGCGGNRDRAKRPRMAAAVDALADHAIITSDNPRNEDPLAIIEDIKPGFRRLAPEVVPDRREAIFHAIAMAQPRDIILLAGKGHESFQEFADHTIPFDDAAIAASALGSRVEVDPSRPPRKQRDRAENQPGPRNRGRDENEGERR